MKSKILCFVLVLLSLKMSAQEPVCKQVKDIAAFEKQASEKRNRSGLLTLASGNYTVHFYKCEWTIDPSKNYITGKVTPHFIVTGSTSSLVFDLSHVLKVDSIYMRNSKLSFSQAANETLTIQLPSTYTNGQEDSLTIYYQGAPQGGGFGSFVQSTHHNGTPVIWTLSEPYGARDWWPCRNGLDDKADSMDIYITHPSQYRASSNGLLLSTTQNSSNTTSYFKHRYPVASYLVALSVTDFSLSTDHVQLGNKNMPVISNVYPEDSALFHDNITPVLNGLQLYSQKFTMYPFVKERYGQTEFGWGGGMEHQTNSFVINPGEGLVTHELAHQWFGDKVTCGSWVDIWLNEGFATYCADFLYTENFNVPQYKINVKSDLDYIVSQTGGSVKVDDTTSVGRIFDGRLSYDKGAYLLRMLRFTMGDRLFFKGLRNYLNDPLLKYNFARTADLQRNLEAVSGLDLNYFFTQWYAGQGYPSFTVKWSQDAANKATITLSQVTSHSSVNFFQVPLQLIFANATQKKTIVVQHTVNNQVVLQDIGFKADTVFIDPNQYLISKNNKSVKLVLANIPQALSAVVSPNPFTNKINISINETEGKKVLLQLFNSEGNIITNRTINSYTKNQNCVLTVPGNISAGTYLLRITAGTSVASYHVIKK